MQAETNDGGSASDFFWAQVTCQIEVGSAGLLYKTWARAAAAAAEKNGGASASDFFRRGDNLPDRSWQYRLKKWRQACVGFFFGRG